MRIFRDLASVFVFGLSTAVSFTSAGSTPLHQPGFAGVNKYKSSEFGRPATPEFFQQSVGGKWEVQNSNKAYLVGDSLPFNSSRVNLSAKPIVTEYPYRAVGRLLNIEGDVVTECTAALIGPSLVVTAAHCVARHGGGYFGDQVFVPASTGASRPFGSWEVVEKKAAQSFLSGTSICIPPDLACQDDVAVLRIQTKTNRSGESYTLGEKIGWLGFALEGYGFNQENPLALASVTHLGYSSRYDGGNEMQRTDAVAIYESQLDQVSLSTPPFLVDGGGPWVLNIGKQADVDIDPAVRDEAPNTVISVSSRDAGMGEVFASRFTTSNFKTLYDAYCADDTRNCALGNQLADPDILVTLEEPVGGESYSGVGNMRGWAVYEFPIDKVEISIDGEPFFEAPYGGQRTDVGAAFPDTPNSEASGFSLAFGYGNLAAGPHTITVRATSITGEQQEETSNFTVQRFRKSFIDSADVVSLAQASVALGSDFFVLEGVVIDSEVYSLELRWNTATQDFDITRISTN